jgi:hypothetical protein
MLAEVRHVRACLQARENYALSARSTSFLCVSSDEKIMKLQSNTIIYPCTMKKLYVSGPPDNHLACVYNFKVKAKSVIYTYIHIFVKYHVLLQLVKYKITLE